MCIELVVTVGHVASRRVRARLLAATMPTMAQWQRLGARVRQDRARMGLKSQQALAHRAGVSRRTVAKLEAGTPVGPDTLIAVEAALGWAPGSVAEVLAGRQPGYEVDPDRGYLLAMWDEMSDQSRRIILAVAEVLGRG